MSALNEVKLAMKLAQEVKQKAIETAKAKLSPALQEFLKDNPVIKSIVWNQYAPYFNDGDPCIFHVNEIYFSTEVIEEYDYNSLEGGDECLAFTANYDIEAQGKSAYVDQYVTPHIEKLGISKETYKAANELSTLLSESEDILEEVFGSDVAVIITESGIDLQDYDHD